jgi:hypothetical protein
MCEDTEKVTGETEGWRPDHERRDTFEVLDHRMAELEHKVAKINRRAAKLGCPEVVLEVSEPYDLPVKDENGDVKYYVRKRTVKVVGEPPRVEGWTLVAKLMHLDGVVIIAAVPGETVPVEFREVSPERCDHCHAHRYRLDTFVLRNEADGSHKVVGRNCLADFLGGHDPKRVAAMCELMIAVGEALEQEEGWNCGGGYYRLDPLDVLARTAVAIREDGWLSRTAARNSMMPVSATADVVSSDFWALDPKYRDLLAKKATEADHKEAAAAWEWAATAAEGSSNDYLYNVQTVSQMTSIDARLLGITCSILVAYRKFMDREIERRKAKAESHHFGEVGKRGVFELTLVGYTSCEGYYGTTHIFRFIEGEGNRVTWFSSRDVEWAWGVDEETGEPGELRRGDTFTVKATVKKHEEYKGVAQTVVTRVAPFTPKPKKARKSKKAAKEGATDVVSN